MVNHSSNKDQPFCKLGHPEKYALLLLSEGRPDGEIARALFLGEGTIRNYVNSILSKLELPDRPQAIAYALKNGLRGHMESTD